MYNILTASNPKLKLGESLGYHSLSLEFLPTTFSKTGKDFCSGFATPECRTTCLAFSGNGRFGNVYNKRLWRSQLYVSDYETFRVLLLADLSVATRLYSNVCLRLNTFSDLDHTSTGLVAEIKLKFPQVTLYDYTKSLVKALRQDYHHTLSYSGYNESECKTALAHGVNVAVVFKKDLPESFWEYPVIDGTDTDLRFLDPNPCVVGLKEKNAVIMKKTDDLVQIVGSANKKIKNPMFI
jgi:hypothetical protein